MTFNGSTASLDGTSDPAAGTSLVVGDTFNLDVHASGNDYWQVNTTFIDTLFATFFVMDGGDRIGNITTTLYLDGTQVAQQTLLNQTQSSVHIGGQTFNMTAGLQFDQLVVAYNFLSSTTSTTTIQGSSDIITFTPFFRDSRISYVDSPVSTNSAVPEPGTLVLLGSGVATVVRRRYRRAGTGSVIDRESRGV